MKGARPKTSTPNPFGLTTNYREAVHTSPSSETGKIVPLSVTPVIDYAHNLTFQYIPKEATN